MCMEKSFMRFLKQSWGGLVMSLPSAGWRWTAHESRVRSRLRLRNCSSSPKASRSSFFSIDPEFQREALPITHVAAGNRYPPFLIFHVGTRADSRGQSEALAERLR